MTYVMTFFIVVENIYISISQTIFFDKNIFLLQRALLKNVQGTVPNELGYLKSLVRLDVYKNNLTGIIPPPLRKLQPFLYL